jgi:putative transposase
MPKKRHKPEQIAAALRQADAGTPIAEITRKLGVHENTFYHWKKRYALRQRNGIHGNGIRSMGVRQRHRHRLLAPREADRQCLYRVVQRPGSARVA